MGDKSRRVLSQRLHLLLAEDPALPGHFVPSLRLCRGRVLTRGAVVARRVGLLEKQQIVVLAVVWGCPEAGMWVACAWPGTRVCTRGGSWARWHRCPAPGAHAGVCGGLSTSGDGIENELPGRKNTGQPSGCSRTHGGVGEFLLPRVPVLCGEGPGCKSRHRRGIVQARPVPQTPKGAPQPSAGGGLRSPLPLSLLALFTQGDSFPCLRVMQRQPLM